MHPLDGPRLKVWRAESEIESLRLAQDTFRSQSDYRVIRSELNPKTGHVRYRIRINSPPPSLEWGVHVGEIAHNLRSALDGLVHQLALLNTKTPARNTQFPIFLIGHTTKGMSWRPRELIYHFEGMSRGDGRSMIRVLKPCHQAMIERLQPYKRGGRGRNSPLYWLKEVNNADKHRLIQIVGAKPATLPFIGGWGDIDLSFMRVQPGMILKDGAILFEVPRGVQVYPKFSPLVAFWEGCPPVKGKAVVNTLRIIANEVSQIIEDFSPEFY